MSTGWRVQRRRSGSGRRCGCRWSSARRSRGAWRGASLCVRSGVGWVGRRRRSRGRSRATVVRRYRACRADVDALRRTRRPKRAKLAQCERLRRVVEDKLELRWSPQQISGWLTRAFPDDPEMRVSHETIYLSLFVQSSWRVAQGTHPLPPSGSCHSPAARTFGDERPGSAPRNHQHPGTTRRS